MFYSLAVFSYRIENFILSALLFITKLISQVLRQLISYLLLIDIAHYLTTYILCACFFIGHYSFRSRNDSDT